PYRVIYEMGTPVVALFFAQPGLWLWVPAFAGTTAVITPPASHPAAHSPARGTWRRGFRNCGTDRTTHKPTTAAPPDRAAPRPLHRARHSPPRHPASLKSHGAHFSRACRQIPARLRRSD